MSKFINTERKDTITSLVDGIKTRLNNPYYINIEQKPTITTYYNQDITKSTLDEGSKTTYSNLGSNSSIKYNKIHNMFIYGIDRINISLENGEFGLESDSIEGEGIILPNTIIPYPNDYFCIKYIERDLLFKILSVSFDTIENGSNLYKIQYKLDQTVDDKIQDQVVNEFEFVVNNVGTTFNPIVRSSDYLLLEKLENISGNLSNYYKTLFFNNRVQAFTFMYNDNYFYDPYMIEFLIRNKVLDKDDNFLYITHQVKIPNTFSIEYGKTFFRYIELNNKDKFVPKICSQAKLIDDPLSLLSSRIEDYFEITYNYPENVIRPIIYNFEYDLLDRILNNNKYDSLDKNRYLNIIIKYFNKENICDDDIVALDNINYIPNIRLYYYMPVIIYIINHEIINIIAKNQDND